MYFSKNYHFIILLVGNYLLVDSVGRQPKVFLLDILINMVLFRIKRDILASKIHVKVSQILSLELIYFSKIATVFQYLRRGSGYYYYEKS